MDDGFVRRYLPSTELDGLPLGEGVFLPCTAWLADTWCLMGDRVKARALFERLLSVRNDVGLLAEEYDPRAQRLLGNFRRPSRTSGLSTQPTIYPAREARRKIVCTASGA